jgi:hypothetical protein
MIVHPDHLTPKSGAGIRKPAILLCRRDRLDVGLNNEPSGSDVNGRKCRGNNASAAWVVNFNNGNCNHNEVGNNNYVRAVRSGKSSSVV